MCWHCMIWIKQHHIYSFDSAAVERLFIWYDHWCMTYCILSFGWFPGVWTLYADTSERSVCSIFLGSISRKNNRDEIVGVFIWERVWLKNSLSQSEGGGGSEYRNRLWTARTPSGGQSKREGEMALCQSEEGEPLDGRDQTIVFEVAVVTSTFSSLSLIATGLFVKLAIYHSSCTNKLKWQMTV
jgi:hypothetical protein